MTKELATVNFHRPTKRDGTAYHFKAISDFAFAIRGIGDTPQLEIDNMKNFFNHSLGLNHSIILSSEVFDEMTHEQVLMLKNLLEGFKVTIVFVYRQFLEQLVSYHFEMHKFDHAFVRFSQSFSGYLFNILDDVPIVFRPNDILKSCSDLFGVANIRIIDLLGVQAAGLDVARVLLCEVANVLCHHTLPTAHINAAYSLIPAQVFSFYKSHVEQQHNGTCTFCSGLFKHYLHFAKRYNNHTTVHLAPNVTTTKLTMLIPYAQQSDINLRTTYGSAILHGNQSANFEAMLTTQAYEIDPEVFMTDRYWNNWIHSEYEHALAVGEICGCSNNGKGN